MNDPRREFSQVEVEASEWIATLSDRTVSLAQRARFQAWLKQDPQHEQVYRIQRAAFEAVGGMSHLLEKNRAAPAVVAASDGRRRRFVSLAAGLVLAIGAGLLVANQSGWLADAGLYETGTAQVRNVRLADGSRITLGAASRIEVELGEHERRIELIRGEAYFDVSRDATRPFFVRAGDTTVRVLGTRFDVRYGETVRVAVLEGRVEVTKSDDAALFSGAPRQKSKKVLTAGQAALAQKSGVIATATNLKPDDLSAWRQGRLVYVDARLRDIVADINRYYEGRIELADAAVGELQLTITFRTDQIDRALEVLEGTIPVQAVHTGPGEILLTRKQPSEPSSQ